MLAVIERVGIDCPNIDKNACTSPLDVHDPGKYRSITLLSHMMKLLERIPDGRIRAVM